MLLLLTSHERFAARTARTYLESALELATGLYYQQGTSQQKIKSALVRAIDRGRDRAAELV
jgi:hypothetical protein